jgi:hypothetical protein
MPEQSGGTVKLSDGRTLGYLENFTINGEPAWAVWRHQGDAPERISTQEAAVLMFETLVDLRRPPTDAVGLFDPPESCCTGKIGLTGDFEPGPAYRKPE